MTASSPEILGCGLSTLPVELLQIIIDELATDPQDSLRALSCTNSLYRNLVAPRFFHSITLRNTEPSGASLEAIAAGKHAHCVRYLHYQGTVGPRKNMFRGSPEDPPDLIPFPLSVQSTLSNLGRFPKLQSVVIEFPFQTWDNDFLDPWNMPDEGESPEKVKQGEEENGLRALLAQSFSALVANGNPKFQHLELRGLPTVAISTFELKAWHDLLEALEGFTISSRGYNNGVGWRISCLPFYKTVVGRLDEWFFNHLSSARHLVLEASAHGPLGFEAEDEPERDRVRLALAPDQMPFLRSVRFRYIWICPKLHSFLISHLDTLEEIVLRDCMVNTADDYHDLPTVPWSNLLDAIYEAAPKKLKELEISWTKQPDLEDEDEDYDWDTQFCEQISAAVREVLQTDPEGPKFQYACVDGGRGTVLPNLAEMRERFAKGDDRKAYQRLIRLVEENKARANAAGADSAMPGYIMKHEWYEEPVSDE